MTQPRYWKDLYPTWVDDNDTINGEFCGWPGERGFGTGRSRWWLYGLENGDGASIDGIKQNGDGRMYFDNRGDGRE